MILRSEARNMTSEIPLRALVFALFLMTICSLLPSSHSFAAEERSRLQGEGVTIYYDSSLQYEAELLKGAYPEIREEIEQKIGWRLRLKPVVFLIADSKTFEKMGGSGDIQAGLALFPKGHIILNLSSFIPHILSMPKTFRHELCHLILHEHIRGRALPKWLDEGVCQWVSETEKEDISSRMERFAMTYALSKKGVPLSQLARKFPDDVHHVMLAYGESRSFVKFMVSRYGRNELLQVLARLKKGDSIDRAFVHALSKPLETVEAEWREDTQKRVRWVLLGEKYMETAAEKLSNMQGVFTDHRRELLFGTALLALLPLTKVLSRKR